jgi:hypothetical protein
VRWAIAALAGPLALASIAVPNLIAQAAGNATEEVGAYGAMGVALAVLLFFLRRWSKMRDDAITAASEARKLATDEAKEQLAWTNARHEAEMLLVKIELANMRSVMSRIMGALTDDTMTTDEKRVLRAEGMRVLFPPNDRGAGK